MDYDDGHFFLGEADGLDGTTRSLARYGLNCAATNNERALDIILEVNGFRVAFQRPTTDVKVWHSHVIERPQPEPTFGDGFFLTRKERLLATSPQGYIPAIRSLRERMKLGLKEAKDHTELFNRTYHIPRPGQPNVGCQHSPQYVTYGICRRCGQSAAPPGCKHDGVDEGYTCNKCGVYVDYKA